MLTHILSFKNQFIQILIFGVFKYTHDHIFIFLDIFIQLKEYPVVKQISVFQVKTLFTLNYLVNKMFLNVDVSNSKFEGVVP